MAAILERSVESTIEAWFTDVQADEKLKAVPLTFAMRTAHLPQLFSDLVHGLRSSMPLGTSEFVSTSAHQHGFDRRTQGCTAAMMVEESRILQVNIFRTLQQNLTNIDFSIFCLSTS